MASLVSRVGRGKEEEVGAGVDDWRVPEKNVFYGNFWDILRQK